MKRSIFILNAALLFSSVLILFPSCQKEPQLTILSENTTVEYSSRVPEPKEIRFSSDRDWTVSCTEEWVHVKPMAGTASDNCSITVSVDPNFDLDDRSAEVVITAEGLTKVITVNQLRSMSFYAEMTEFLINSEARTIESNVVSNYEYTVEIRADWIRQVGTKGTTKVKLAFSVADNPSPEGRTGIIELKAEYGSLQTVTKKIIVRQMGCASETPEAVDLGLSVKWASFNVGATRAEEPGSLYAWGETTPKEEYTEATYEWLGPDGLTKYCDNDGFGTVDSKTQLEREDDAAFVAFGEGWHMPTVEQTQELVQDTKWEYVNIYGIEGTLFKGKKEGFEDKWMFLPLVWDPEDPIDRSPYWTSTLYPQSAPMHAYTMCAGKNAFQLYWINERRCGRPVRAVKD